MRKRGFIAYANTWSSRDFPVYIDRQGIWVLQVDDLKNNMQAYNTDFIEQGPVVQN